MAQIAEKERLTSEQKHADRLYHMKACELDQRAVDLACAEAETRRNITTATKDYNLALVHTHSAIYRGFMLILSLSIWTLRFFVGLACSIQFEILLVICR